MLPGGIKKFPSQRRENTDAEYQDLSWSQFLTKFLLTS